MRRIVVLLLVIATFCLGAAFSYHNPQAVTLNYLAGQTEIALGALVMATVAFSVAVMVLMFWLISLPRRAETLRLRRRLEKAENELHNLRQLPLKDG